MTEINLDTRLLQSEGFIPLMRGVNLGLERAKNQSVDTDAASIRVQIKPEKAQNEFGIGGGIDDGPPRQIVILIDPAKINAPDFARNIARFVVHEYNHIERTRNNENAVVTLGGALISEGFALCAEREAGFSENPYGDFSSDAKAEAFEAAARAHLDDDLKLGSVDNQYGFWFFGPDPKKPDPRDGGYALGAAIVSDYLFAHNLSVAEATRLPAPVILEEWKNTPQCARRHSPRAPAPIFSL